MSISKKYLFIAALAEASDLIGHGNMMISHGAGSNDVVKTSEAAAQSTLTALMLFVTGGNDPGPYKFADFYSRNFELVKYNFADEEFYDRWRQILNFCESPSSASLEMNRQILDSLGKIIEIIRKKANVECPRRRAATA